MFEKCLPAEIWHHVVNFIFNVDDLKSMSLVSTLFNNLVNRKMWRRIKLRISHGIHTIKDLPVQELDMSNVGCSGSHLSAVATMNALRSLNISGNEEITDIEVSYLANLTKLKVLIMSGCKNVTPVGLCTIAHLPLEELNVSNCRLNENHLEIIKKMKFLRTLVMNFNRVRDTSMSYLLSLNQLQSLSISGCRNINPSSLASLEKIPLSELHMDNVCSDLHLSFIGKCKSLKKLNIHGNNKVSDVGLAHITGLSKLTILDVGYCENITSAGLYSIHDLPLQELYMSNFCSDLHLTVICHFYKSMRKLDICYSWNVTDSGIALMSQLPKLIYLNIKGCSFVSVAGRASVNNHVVELEVEI